jgi:hypothetical protein
MQNNCPADANSFVDEAVAIAQECPGLSYGAKVEVRPVMDQCPLAAEAMAEAQVASATA